MTRVAYKGFPIECSDSPEYLDREKLWMWEVSSEAAVKLQTVLCETQRTELLVVAASDSSRADTGDLWKRLDNLYRKLGSLLAPWDNWETDKPEPIKIEGNELEQWEKAFGKFDPVSFKKEVEIEKERNAKFKAALQESIARRM